MEIVRDLNKEAATALFYTATETLAVIGYFEGHGVSVVDWLPLETNAIEIFLLILAFIIAWSIQYAWRFKRITVNENGITIERISGKIRTCYWKHMLVAEYKPLFLHHSWRIWTTSNERISLFDREHLYKNERKIVNEAIINMLRAKGIPIRNEPKHYNAN